MEKTIHGDEYQAVVSLLKELRKAAGLTQVEMAARLNQSQSLFSKYERGELRLDIIQLRTMAAVLGLSLTDFSRALEQRLNATTQSSSRQRKSSIRR